jgi:ADP-ribosylation factor GTPase-activating protein 2/3
MQEQERSREFEIQQQTKNKEEQEKAMEKQMASMKLAYNNLDQQREKEEAKLLKTDPKKAQQLERLGMAVGTRGGGITHSAISDMQIIQQEGSFNNSSKSSSKRGEFFDEMDGFFSKSNNNGNGNTRDNDDDFRGFGSCKYKSDFFFIQWNRI